MTTLLTVLYGLRSVIRVYTALKVSVVVAHYVLESAYFRPPRADTARAAPSAWRRGAARRERGAGVKWLASRHVPRRAVLSQRSRLLEIQAPRYCMRYGTL